VDLLLLKASYVLVTVFRSDAGISYWHVVVNVQVQIQGL